MEDTEKPELVEIFGRFLKTLEITERAPRTKVRQYQGGLLRQLLHHARSTVPYYRERLSLLFNGDDLDLSRWREVPILTRALAVEHHAALQSDKVPPEAGAVEQAVTTGTTGKPLRISYNALNRIAANAALARTARWWGIDPSGAMAKIVIYLDGDPVDYPAGRDSRGWCLSDPNSDVHELDMFTPERDQIEFMLRKRPVYLSTSPVNATALAYAISPAQVRELGLKAILSYGETVLPLARRVVPETFGAPLVAIYSCQEVGYIATQCPVTSHYHVMSENVLVEILRDDGSACAPGETGQVVVTGFYNYAMPFIRYAIGDVATAGPDYCTCGLTLPVIEHVVGRTRHAFVFEDGSRFWPRMGNFDPSPFVACREFQLVQIDHHTLELRYVAADERVPDQAGLDAYVRDKIHPSVRAILAPMQAVPRGPGGKLMPFISMVED